MADEKDIRWQHDPKVTENSLMKFSVQGDQLILQGDDGRHSDSTAA
jgi:hypothetical protein